MSEAFDHIPFKDLVQPFSHLGSGSFGSVYRSTYLGLPVALKQITPSTSYDVSKYFEREWRLMREARHPNVVLYLGLSTDPADGKVYIVSEFVEGGNLRGYIYDKRKPLGWGMRVSFCVDIARALAYLHARKCIHRDLKPENLLLTSNLRLKITDFGFARIAPRSSDEARRLTFCGTDAYMSPEILLGDPFDLPTDVYSLGIILVEIISRQLADERHFKRSAPFWSIDQGEVRRKAEMGCPEGLVELTLDCLSDEPGKRPEMVEVLERLGRIERELEVVEKKVEGEGEGHVNVGSLKFATGGKNVMSRMGLPNFDGSPVVGGEEEDDNDNDDEDDKQEEEELEAALKELGLSIPTPAEEEAAAILGSISANSEESSYSTTVIKPHHHHPPKLNNSSSILTIRPSDSQPQTQTNSNTSDSSTAPLLPQAQPPNIGSLISIDSFHTAIDGDGGEGGGGGDGNASEMSIAAATIGEGDEGHDTLKSLPDVRIGLGLGKPPVPPPAQPIPVPMAVWDREAEDEEVGGEAGEGGGGGGGRVHRFTMIKPKPAAVMMGKRPPSSSSSGSSSNGGEPAVKRRSSSDLFDRKGIFSFFKSPSPPPPAPLSTSSANKNGGGGGSGSGKCDLCKKRLGLGFKTVLECDDCGLRVHVKCGEVAPKTCGSTTTTVNAARVAGPRKMDITKVKGGMMMGLGGGVGGGGEKRRELPIVRPVVR